MNQICSTPRLEVRQDPLIAETYMQMREPLKGYIRRRIDAPAVVEDLMQETFARILEYNTLLDARTLVRLVYTVARNLIVDYLRRHARSRVAQEYFARHAPRSSNRTADEIDLHELERTEERCLVGMSPRRAQIYRLYIQQGRSVEEISENLSLSRRTVENHIFTARSEMRRAFDVAI